VRRGGVDAHKQMPSDLVFDVEVARWAVSTVLVAAALEVESPLLGINGSESILDVPPTVMHHVDYPLLRQHRTHNCMISDDLHNNTRRATTHTFHK
jgi:hypothetical protein